MEKIITIEEIINFLADEIISVNGNPAKRSVKYLRAPENTDEFTLDWIGDANPDKQQIAEISTAMSIIIGEGVNYSKKIQQQKKLLIQVENPKLTIAKIANQFFTENIIYGIHPSAVIHPDAIIGKNIFIGPNVILGNCIIGDNVILIGNCFIYDNVILGNNIEIHNGVSIGNEAHNFVKDKEGKMIKFPHLGRVIIEDNVLIGANSVISRGVLEDTLIKSGCKIAQLVIIGANNIIEENCSIRANVMTSGSVKIGRNSIIAPTVTIREHRSIGHNCFIGMGAVVTKSVPDCETWIGNPARKM
jgi:UDP-3-O-[3-hydroxymyristoyl] glucosamine N-acyltransferase